MAGNTELEKQDAASRASLNFHRSPAEAVPCLLSVEGLRLRRFLYIDEVACGDGALVLPLREAGFVVRAADIVDRGCPQSGVTDFLAREARPTPRVACFTNPPFNMAEEFVVHACNSFDYVAMILRLRFLAAKHLIDEFGTELGEQGPIWQQTRIPLARVIVPKSRWPMMHRDGYTGKKTKGGMTDFAIFVWDADHKGAPLIIREPDERYQPQLLKGAAA